VRRVSRTPTFEDVREAASRIDDAVLRTPRIASTPPSAATSS